MKKVSALAATASTFLLSAQAVLAQTPTGVRIDIVTPDQGLNPGTPVGALLSNILTIIFIVAAIAVLFMLIWGAFQWITSGGEKEAVQKARGRIVNALIGLAVLAMAFLITRVAGSLVGINILDLDVLPRLDECPAGTRKIVTPGRTEFVCQPTSSTPATRP